MTGSKQHFASLRIAHQAVIDVTCQLIEFLQDLYLIFHYDWKDGFILTTVCNETDCPSSIPRLCGSHSKQ